ncbi:MAG: SDR family NAD(P)-dependent oxidoreductase, partial [Chloroflexi bacterium]|nr:SDR family NAD(P)-dependent oxidoreductase [Chloroflexota bacterium]
MITPNDFSISSSQVNVEFSGGTEAVLRNGEPIAVVGIACRFPGANDVSEFWRLLETGANAVSDGVPSSGEGRLGEIFRDTAMQSEASCHVAFIDGVDRFDAPFFRISPVEAHHLDPQQRLMLETSWQALEDAGIDHDGLQGSRTGVYAGISNMDYRGMIMQASDTSEPASSLYTVTGTSYNTAIGRVAFALGLNGPALALDTACSSSLVAIHQAMSALRLGEADLALAGGVHTILSGRLLDLRGNAGMLAPDGRCKTFDAAADGYVRGEGCGIVVLKRLSDAEADGDRIWGVIRGSAVNQDGASTGLTVPSEEAQRHVIEEALHKAGVLPAQVDYVEAHGTGTPVGDPIELRAVAGAYGTGRPTERPLLIGSVKTNFGHLEPAAGVAAVMKVLLSMNKGIIPKHLNFYNPTPAVDWDNLSLRVTATATEWPQYAERAPLAGVSGFGWSGTNAHLIIEGYRPSSEAPESLNGAEWPSGLPRQIAVSALESDDDAAVEVPSKREKRLLPLSGKSDSALRELADRYLTWLDERYDSADSTFLSDMAWTAGVGRSHFTYRTGVTFSDAESLRAELKAVARGEGSDITRTATRVAFVYTGQGSQWLGMGRTLYESEPVVRAVLDRCERVMQEERGTSLLDVMFGNEGAEGDLNDTAWTQPAVYALESALTALWRSIGVEPSVVIGHSLGEFAAAQSAGVFGLEEGLRFVAKRGALLSSVPDLGTMAAIFDSKEKVAAVVSEYNSSTSGVNLSVAVDNGVHQVISGTIEAVDAVSEKFDAEEITVRRLRNQAFHSPLVEPALNELEEAYKSVKVSSPSISLVSNVTGRVVSQGETIDGKYWRRHARNAVQFRSGIETMAELGVDLIIEGGPHAVLGPLVSLVWPDSANGSFSEAPSVLQSMLRLSWDIDPADYDDGFMDAVAGAYNAGLALSFEGLFAGEERRRIKLPGYPFQRERYWIDTPRRIRSATEHPLLGNKHESPRGEVMFETEMFSSDPAWLNDHRVFGRVIMPGAMYGAMAAAAALSEGTQSVDVEDLQLHTAMAFSDEEGEGNTQHGGRRIQAVLSAPEKGSARQVEIFSKSETEEGWTLHAEGKVSAGVGVARTYKRKDVDTLKSGMATQDVAAYYRARTGASIDFGPSFRTIQRLWAANGEAVGEIASPDSLDMSGIDMHPLLLDGCFQVLSAARHSARGEDEATYLPFGWERLWLRQRLPDRFVCHARLRETARESEEGSSTAPEVLIGDLQFYTLDGIEIGGLSGYTVKSATRTALLSETEGLQDLLYEVVWRNCPLADGMPSADFLTNPSGVATQSKQFAEYLADEGVDARGRVGLLRDLERMSWLYSLSALERLGWERKAGDYIEPESLRESLSVLPEHRRLFRRMFELLASARVVDTAGDGFVVRVGPGDTLPSEMQQDIAGVIEETNARYWHGSTEVGLLRRCGAALADVLTGQADALTLLFSSGEPTAGDLYLKSPVARAANRMIADSIATLLTGLPEGRKLRILEVGAGTGAATTAVLPELPDGSFEYTYTDISAGFFSEAESRFGGDDGSIEYRVLDIEKDAAAQGFDLHSYDLIIASNVLHATRRLDDTLVHCRELLRPSGQLVALEILAGTGWQDLTFGLLDGWWRFADDYRRHHALAGPVIWKRALADTGFVAAEVIGVDEYNPDGLLDRGIVVAKGPEQVNEAAGAWVIAGDGRGVADELAAELARRNQIVVVAGAEGQSTGQSTANESAIRRAVVDSLSRESWRALLESLPSEVPISGIVHLVALDGYGEDATAEEFGEDVRQIGGSALALVQGISDADATPANGIWLVTRGGQVLEREHGGQLAGAMLWGFGKVVAQEAGHLQPRMLDVDPANESPLSALVNELMYPDNESHIAYRMNDRKVARLVRVGSETERLTLPEGSRWSMAPDAGGDLDALQVLDLPERALDPREVRVVVDAAGLNFRDVLRSLGIIDTGLLGRELCGHVLEIGSDVTSVSVGDRVVALGFGTLGSEADIHEELVAPAPAGMSTAYLATIPTVFVTAAISFDLARLKSGERVLIHASTGGVGLAAVQLARAAGAEVFATASASKQAYLRSLGVKNVFDSRQTKFGQEIHEATGGEGVDVVLNSLTGEGFIETSLSCLTHGGRFIELSRVDILSEDEMAALRPDVEYHILDLDALKQNQPEQAGAVLKSVIHRIETGELKPLAHSRWSMSEAVSAMKFMRAARHIGKIVLTNSPLETGRLREDRTYLVTGGLGGIGCVLADWLAERGAGAIVLNGRRAPDTEALETIAALREQGVTVQVELADVTDMQAVDAMLERIDATLPPLAGVIHSVGVLSDAALPNQTWDNFRQVLWPKMLGAWHLHRATMHRDLEMFIVFSSVAGVMGNAGQANHSAANAFLDQLAVHRRALGLPCQSIAWGAWSELGEAAEQRGRIAAQLEAAGTGWITPQQGLNALESIVRQDLTTGMVASVDWPTIAENSNEASPFLEDLIATSAEDAVEEDKSSDDLLTQLQGSQQADSESILVSFLQKELQAVMRLPSAPATSVGFFDLGMDSLMSVELRNRLNRTFAGEIVVSNTAVFDYPDITALARHLADELGQIDDGGASDAAAFDSPAPIATKDDDIAIVGMACRFPQAKNLSEYWHLLENGTDAITDGRPDVEDAPRIRGAFVDGIEWFDSRFFRIAPIEARMMDPRQRMMLETSWEALEDAGIAPDGLRGSLTGVYVGVGDGEYRELIDANGMGGSLLGTTASVTAGRVAFAFGLEGPAMAIDMACASALAAVHQAIAALQRGEINLALAGGVNAVLSPAVSDFMMEAGMLSPSGQGRPFDASADGYVRGEGCGIVVLKRVSEAEANGDHIWGIIKGSAVNQNGASAGLTVPNGPAQERVMQAALETAGISGAEVDYLEVHAVGSQLADAIEVRAVGSVYGKEREDDRPLLMGTVKSNIGHLEAAAGVAGLIKSVLAMKARVIPAQIHFKNPNPQIEWDQWSVRVASEKTEWQRHIDRPPRSAVSAFGMSGTNAHLIVEGYGSAVEDWTAGIQAQLFGPVQPVSVSLPDSVGSLPTSADGISERTTRFLPISGKTESVLQELARQYISWLDRQDAETSTLADLAWTAGVGRSHFDHRSGVVFSDALSLREGLTRLAKPNSASDDAERQSATKVAFLYSGDSSRWVGMSKTLYDTEPVARAVLDLCDAVVFAERGESLLAVMFGSLESVGDLNDAAWAQPALYSLECALSALWASVGILPNVSLGRGTGELAAAQAAGAYSLEDGLRFAMARSNLMAVLPGGDPNQSLMGLEVAFDDIAVSPPSLTLVSGVTGRVIDSDNPLDSAYWRRQAHESAALEVCASTLAELGVDLVL